MFGVSPVITVEGDSCDIRATAVSLSNRCSDAMAGMAEQLPEI
jgi:hypothetical protein